MLHKCAWSDIESNVFNAGALLKTTIHCAEVINLSSPDETLQEQLMRQYGGGIELNTWSDLPHGSGKREREG